MLLHSFPFDSRSGPAPASQTRSARRAARSSLRTAVAAAGRAGRMIRARTRATPAHDVTCLIDHLGLDQVDLAGYSVGSMIGLRVLQAASRRSEYIQAVYEEQQS